jgi:hypothetical protein
MQIHQPTNFSFRLFSDVIELPYRWMLVVRKTSFAPLPPGTKPLPPHLARKPESRKDLAPTIPHPGTPFCDANSGFQWAEFECVGGPREATVVRVDLARAEQMWYYLGESSTECRAQYTHDPSIAMHNPRSNFLESLKSLSALAAGRLPSYPHHFSAPPNPLLQRHSLSLQRHSLPNSTMTPSYRSVPGPNATRPASLLHFSKTAVDPPANTYANVRELIARRRLAQITDHANVFAGYTIVSPELVVETLLGPMGSVPPTNGMEKLELAMAQQRVQPKAADGTLLPLQPLNMRSEEVTRLLRMLRFSLFNNRDRPDGASKVDPDILNKSEPVDYPSSLTLAKLASKFAYLDKQRAQSPTIYRSPYESPSGFSEWAKIEFGLPREPRRLKRSLASDYFSSLSPEKQEKILKACGGIVQQQIIPPASHSRQSSSSNFRLSSALARQTENPTIDITTVETLPMTGLDMPLHADSPASSFSRAHVVGYPSPNDFASHGDHDSAIVPRHLQDHHDLFGDQQANTRFWQQGPWVAGDGTTPNEEHRPFFGPHERLKHDYASSDMSIGRGPGSLHSVDIAGFGLDGTDDLCAELSP